MTVAIIADPFVPVPPPKYGGTEKVIYYLIKGLIEAGQVPILLGPGDSKVECRLVPIVEKSFSFPKDKDKVPEFKKHLAETRRNTEKLLRELLPEIDVIHSHGFDLSNFKDFPNVTTLHGPIVMDKKSLGDKDITYFEKHEELNYITISKNQALAHPHLNYIRVVYNGEDPSEFPFIKRPSNYVCFVGRFDHEKNPHLAILLAIKYGIQIKLGGKIDYIGNDYFKKEVKPLLKHPLVEYLGELNRKQTIEVLSRAKCNLHPTSFREPFGLTVLEAAYCGTPTMAITRGSMPELIEEGKTGILVEDFVEGFHEIEKSFSLDRLYIAQRARKKFNYKNMTKGYIRAYRKAIREHKKHPAVVY